MVRYNAERESWGLDEVQAYRFTEREPDGCDLGDDFHNDSENRRVAPRPGGQRWSASDRRQFQTWKDSLIDAVGEGRLRGGEQGENLSIDLTNMNEQPMNWFGHAIEATTFAFYERYGSFHNNGHGVFGRIGQRSWETRRSYMNTTANAVRDPIFYRWHKHVDDVMYELAQTLGNEVDRDAPPLNIDAGDILLSTSETPPSGFDNFDQSFASTVNVVNTRLDEPQLRFETGKLSHDPFYFHIRLRRNGGSGDLPLSLRIFICPENHVNDARRWIEMDKFRYNFLCCFRHRFETLKAIS